MKSAFSTYHLKLLSRRQLLASAAGALAGTLLPVSSTRAAKRKSGKAGAPKKPAADPYADGILVDGEPPLPRDGAFTFAVLPDTQHYSERYPDTYLAQTRWLTEQKQRRRIAGVVHLGDITNHSTPAEWENARRAMKLLEDASLPYAITPGNHDYSDGGTCRDRTTRLNDYFKAEDLRKLPHWGGTYDKEPDRMENNYQLMEAGGRKFLVLGIEFGPRNDVIRWAGETVSRFRDREIILLTHAFIYDNDTRYDWKKYGAKQRWNPHTYKVAAATGGDVNDGEELWQKLVSQHDHFILTLNGHVLHDGLGRVTTKTGTGRAIPQLLVNFQMRPNGGDGWLRLLEMRPGGELQVYDYSPVRGQRNESRQNQFTLQLPKPGNPA